MYCMGLHSMCITISVYYNYMVAVQLYYCCYRYTERLRLQSQSTVCSGGLFLHNIQCLGFIRTTKDKENTTKYTVGFILSKISKYNYKVSNGIKSMIQCLTYFQETQCLSLFKIEKRVL